MCMLSDDFEPWTVHRRNERRARKPHVCTECWRRIEPGENYVEVVGLCDGQWDRFTTCRHCEAAGRWLEVACGGYPYTMLGEELYEHRPATDSLLDRLHDAFLTKWDNGTAAVPCVEAVVADAKAYRMAMQAA